VAPTTNDPTGTLLSPVGVDISQIDENFFKPLSLHPSPSEQQPPQSLPSASVHASGPQTSFEGATSNSSDLTDSSSDRSYSGETSPAERESSSKEQAGYWLINRIFGE
jgi:hypothetical protein